MKMVSLERGISLRLADVQDQAEWNRAVEEVNWMIISCLVSTGHPKGRKWEMKSFGFSLETVLLRFEFVGSPNEVTPSEKRRWLAQDLINTTSTQFGSVIISLSVLCKALPQARCEREGDRSRWGRPKWTTHNRHEFWPQKLGRSSWSFGWGVSQRSSNGRMVIILGEETQARRHDDRNCAL